MTQFLVRKNLITVIVFILINNQLLSLTNANDFNTNYYVTNSFKVLRRGRGGDPQQNKRGRTWAESDVFRILVKMRPLYKLRQVNW